MEDEEESKEVEIVNERVLPLICINCGVAIEAKCKPCPNCGFRECEG